MRDEFSHKFTGLRTIGHDARLVPAEAIRAIAGRRRVIRRVQLSGLASLLLLLAVVLAVKPGSSARSMPADGATVVVPWSAPADPPVEPWQPAPLHATARACAAQDLRVPAYRQSSPAATRVFLVNRGERPCTLSGALNLAMIMDPGSSWPAGAPGLPVDTKLLPDQSGAGVQFPAQLRATVPAVTLFPAEGTFLDVKVELPPRCAPPTADAHTFYAIAWPDGARTEILSYYNAPACANVAVSGWHPGFLAGNYEGLNAKIKAPASVRAGEILRYTVELHNATATLIELVPCPTFSQHFISTNGGPLPCAIGTIAPGQTIVYEMQIETATAGTQAPDRNDVMLSWQLDDVFSWSVAVATAHVTVIS